MKKISLLSVLITTALSVQAQNWAEFYQVSPPQILPEYVQQDSVELDFASYKSSGLHLNLNQLLSHPDYQSSPNNRVYIAADTLEISEDININPNNQTLVIFARRILGPGRLNINVDIRERNSVSLYVLTEELDTQININTQLEREVQSQSVSLTPDTLGYYYNASQGQSNFGAMTEGRTRILARSANTFLDTLGNSFDMAASVYSQLPQTSLAMLDWVEKALRLAPALRNSSGLAPSLYLQSANLAQFIRFATQNPGYVPGLNRSLYESTYDGYLDAMQAYQVNYDQFVQQGRDIDERQADAELMLANLRSASAAESQIIARSEQQVTTLEISLDSQKREFADQQTNVDDALQVFKDGIREYKREQRAQLALGAIGFIRDIVLTGGDPTALFELVSDLPNTSQELIEQADKIKAMGALFQDVREASTAISALQSDTQGDISADALVQDFSQLDVTVPNLERATLVWDDFILDTRVLLQDAIDEGIGGASDYLVAVEKMVYRGKAISATEIALAEELSRQIDLRISAQVNLAQIDRVEVLLQDINTDQGAVARMESEFYRALNSLKRPMFVALANYEDAYNYWALEDSKVTPTLNQSYAEYRRDLAFLREQEAATLERFNPRPQDFMLKIMELNHPAQLKDFAGDGELAFTLNLDTPEFDEFDRVRLNEIDVVIQGKNLPEDTRYSIDINTSGHYADRFEDQSFVFHAEPLFRRISYVLTDAATSEVDVITNGAIASDYAINYFEPTPFTTWSIRLRNPQDYDLSQVESIRLEFKGHAIPRID